MGDVEVVIDCRTCYRLQNCGGRYYCPFAGLQPCFRGIHTTHVPAGKRSGIDYRVYGHARSSARRQAMFPAKP